MQLVTEENGTMKQTHALKSEKQVYVQHRIIN